MNIGHIFSKQLKRDINGNAILKVFFKVFNEQVGFPYIAHMEREPDLNPPHGLSADIVTRFDSEMH